MVGATVFKYLGGVCMVCCTAVAQDLTFRLVGCMGVSCSVLALTTAASKKVMLWSGIVVLFTGLYK